MQEIVDDYASALERGRKASERMHSRYKWSDAAAKFITICERALSLPVSPRTSAPIPAEVTA